MLRYLCCGKELIFGAVLLAISLSLPAGAYPPMTDQWHWDVTPYYWRSDISGDVSVGGTVLPVDVSFEDIEDKIDTGIILDLTVTKPSSRVGYLFDLLYLKLEGERAFPTATISSEMKQTIAELGILYFPKSMVELKQARTAGAKSLPYGVYAGARYQSLKVDLTNETTGVSGSADQNWVEPMVGALVDLPLKGNFSTMLRGDVGGFGVGESELTWNGVVDLRYRFKNTLWLNVGYRWLGIDTTNDGNGADITYSGPLFGITHRF